MYNIKKKPYDFSRKCVVICQVVVFIFHVVSIKTCVSSGTKLNNFMYVTKKRKLKNDF